MQVVAMGKDAVDYQTELVCMVPMHDTSAADAARSATHLLSDAVGPSIGNRGKGSDGAEGPFWNFGPVGWTRGGLWAVGLDKVVSDRGEKMNPSHHLGHPLVPSPQTLAASVMIGRKFM